MGWHELPRHAMTLEVARALVAPGLAHDEPIEHVAWGGELPTWSGVRRGLARLGRSAAVTAKELRPEQAIAGVALFGVVTGASFLGAQGAEDLLTVGSPAAPVPSRLGFLLVSTRARLILLEVYRCMVDPPPGRAGVRTIVGVHGAFWWTHPIAPSVPIQMSEQRVLWKPVVTLIFRDDGAERRLSFPAQPGMPRNLDEARAIAKICPEGSVG